MDEKIEIEKADIKWYHNVGFVLILGVPTVLFISAGVYVGYLLGK